MWVQLSILDYIFIGFIALVIAFIFTMALTFIIEFFRKKQNQRYLDQQKEAIKGKVANYCHPYICTKCSFDMIGTVAANKNHCPECNQYHPDWKNIDFLIAKALIKNDRVPSQYPVYYIYALAQNTKPPVYYYKITILAENNIVAEKAAISMFGQQSIAVQAFKTNKQINYIPYSLTVPTHYAALAILNDINELEINYFDK